MDSRAVHRRLDVLAVLRDRAVRGDVVLEDVEKQPLGSFFLTASGLEAAKLAEELCDQEEEQRADEEATRSAERANLDQQAEKQFRHDWRIAIFETVAGFLLGAIADHFFDVVGNASGAVLAFLRALGLLH